MDPGRETSLGASFTTGVSLIGNALANTIVGGGGSDTLGDGGGGRRTACMTITARIDYYIISKTFDTQIFDNAGTDTIASSVDAIRWRAALNTASLQDRSAEA
jgi:Ca2+-binding RTX toxin-like protein